MLNLQRFCYNKMNDADKIGKNIYMYVSCMKSIFNSLVQCTCTTNNHIVYAECLDEKFVLLLCIFRAKTHAKNKPKNSKQGKTIELFLLNLKCRKLKRHN